MDKAHPSRWSNHRLNYVILAAVFLSGQANSNGKELSPAEARQIGKRIWQNECNGTVSGLTS